MASLEKKLQGCRAEIARAAQAILDAWEQDEEGEDDTYGGGGPCDDIAQEIMGVIAARCPDVSTMEGGHDGDDHAFVVAYTETEACNVNIPPGVYEVGGGYSWTKIEGIRVKAADVVVTPIPRNWLPEELDDA
jgi:hypothetical protein